PALAQDPPAEVPAVVTTPQPVVVTPAPPPAAAPTTVVVTHPERGDAGPRAYPGLIWGGIALWGVAYSATAIGAAVANDACSTSTDLCIKGRGVLYIPVAGPFIGIAGVEGTRSSTLKTMLAIDGAFQL